MNLSRAHKVRPKFLALTLLALGLLFLIGGIYTVGLWLPMFLMSIPLFITKSDNAIGVIPDKIIQFCCLIAVTLGIVFHIIYGVGFAIGWYITAVILSISFKVIRIAFISI